nr:LOG family protein [Chloroflexota bacterium]
GIGTLAEAAAMWSQLQTGATSPRPLILIGMGWQKTFQTLFESLDEYIAEKDRDLLSLAQDVESAYHILQAVSGVSNP